MVTKYNSEDIEQIINLGREINPKFAELFKIDSLPELEEIFVYKDNNQVLGFLHILVGIEKTEILNLIVKEENRNQGIASILLDYILSTNDKDIILEVRESNLPAINFYKKFNFLEISARKDYYEDEDGIIMERRKN